MFARLLFVPSSISASTSRSRQFQRQFLQQSLKRGKATRNPLTPSTSSPSSNADSSLITTNNNKSTFLTSLKAIPVRFFSSNPGAEHRVKDDYYSEDFLSSLQRKNMLFKCKMIEKQQISIPLPKFLTNFIDYIRQLQIKQQQEQLQDHHSPYTSSSSSSSPYDPSHHQHQHQSTTSVIKSQVNDSLIKFIDKTKEKYEVKENIKNHNKSLIFPYSFSDLAGHGSFLFLALSYLENDFLHLRLYAFSGICLSIIFQYYREKPLWIPIRWNSIFLLINAVMILLLLKEEDDARNIPDEQKLLYKNIFEQRGMKPVDYLHLISVAKRFEFKKGEKLVDETKKNTRVYLIKHGNCLVLKNGQKVGNIKKHQFVGAMSFLTWEASLAAAEQLSQVSNKNNNANKSPLHTRREKVGPITSLLLDIVPDDVEMTFNNTSSTWKEEISTEVPKSSSVALLSNPLSSSSAVPVEVKSEANKTNADSSADYSALVWNYAVNTWQSLYSAANLAAESITTHDNNKNTNTVPPNQGLTINTSFTTDATSSPNNPSTPTKSGSPTSASEEGHLGRADVVAEEDCIVFSWKFKDLHNLIIQNPSLGLVFERCLSEDLNKKMSTSWDEEIKIRYKQILLGALMDGEINKKEKKILEKFRLEYTINDDDHENILKELDWSLHDYDMGYKGELRNEDVEQVYIDILAKELDDTKGLSAERKRFLRNYRHQHDISSDVHYAALKHLGWTLDDYEVGKRLEDGMIYIDEDVSAQPVSTGIIGRRPILNWFKQQLQSSAVKKTNDNNISKSSDSVNDSNNDSDNDSDSKRSMMADNPFIAHVVDVDHLLDIDRQ
mmetsp:Transcript_7142/g.7811  ORF Transcript_7142/g.7811 Transcript_7142/m.7811 type:complete len:835 (+) Transcript_7142:390-2894(+)